MVLAGGSGTRFWPLSSAHRPKQLLDLNGQGVLLWQTFERIRNLIQPENWWLVCGAAHGAACRDAVPDISAGHCLNEPQGRNTAPALGLGAIHLLAEDPDAIMVILPADHHIGDGPAFCRALQRAVAIAETSAIVTLGIAPTRPETGYGYIERGAAFAREGAYEVVSFCEKPDLAKANAYVESGNFDWNAGVFVVRAQRMMDELKLQQPELFTGLTALAATIGTSKYDDTLHALYETLPAISIDYAVMEHAQNVVVVPVECGWSDVGSLGSLDGVLEKDQHNNLIMGNTIRVDTENCTLIADEDHVVATIGVRDLVVVHTRNATLVVPRERAQEVRQIVNLLADSEWNDLSK